MIDPKETTSNPEFERKIRSAFQVEDPDQLFIDQLQKRLADKFAQTQQSKGSMGTRWLGRGKLLLSPLAWGAIALILILFMIWGIRTLIPRIEPVQNIQSSPAPSIEPTAIPTQSAGDEAIVTLPVTAGMEVPWPEEAITAENASQVTLLARWGQDPISTVAWAPDGNSFAVSSSTVIRIYDSATFQLIRTIDNGSNAYEMAYSPDGMLLAVGAYDNLVKIWDVASGSELRTIQVNQGTVTSLCFSPEGVILETGSDESDGTISLWDAYSGQEIRTISDSGGYTFTLSPDWSKIATVHGSRTIILLDTASGELLQTITNNDDIYGITFSPDGTSLASWSADMNIKLWEVATGNEQSTINLGKFISTVGFLPDRHTLITVTGGEPVKLWDISSGQMVRTFGDSSPWGNFLLSPDGMKLLLYDTSGDNIKLFDIASGSELNKLDWQSFITSSLAVSADGSLVAVGLESGAIKLLASANGQEIRTLIGHTGGIQSLAFSPDGSMLASGSVENKLWDLTTGAELHTWEGVERGWVGGLASVAFSADGKVLAYGVSGGRVALWDVLNQKDLQVLGGDDGEQSVSEITSIAFSPDGTILASGHAMGSIALWDTTNGQLIYALRGHTASMTNHWVSALAFSQDGSLLVSGSNDMELKLWDISSGSEIRTLSFSAELSSAEFSADGSVLAVGSGIGSIALVDVFNNKTLNTLPSATNALAFSSDGKLLITGSYDGYLRLWGVAPPKVIQTGTIPTPQGEMIVSVATPIPRVSQEDLGIEKASLPILSSAADLQPLMWSPDGMYLVFSQQGPSDESVPDQGTTMVSFLKAQTGEICPGFQETVKLVDQGYGMFPEGPALYERISWLPDNRLLYVSPTGEFLAITPCSDVIENWTNLIPDKMLSFNGGTIPDGTKVLLKGEQGYWLFTISTNQVVKLDLPASRGSETGLSWSPWEERLISSRIEDRQGDLWIVLESIDPDTGESAFIYDVRGSDQLRYMNPMGVYPAWVTKDQILIDNLGRGMGLLNFSSQPARYTDLLADVFKVEGSSINDFTGWGTMPHTNVMEYIHVILETGFSPDGQLYLYHPENGLVDQYPLKPPFLIVYPGGEGSIVKPSTDETSWTDVYKVIFIDSDRPAFDLEVKGHISRIDPTLTANVLPGAQQVLFNSDQGVSLVDLTSGATLKFWEYSDQDKYQFFSPSVSPDGKTVVFTALGKTESGEWTSLAVMYWLRLEP